MLVPGGGPLETVVLSESSTGSIVPSVVIANQSELPSVFYVPGHQVSMSTSPTWTDSPGHPRPLSLSLSLILSLSLSLSCSLAHMHPLLPGCETILQHTSTSDRPPFGIYRAHEWSVSHTHTHIHARTHTHMHTHARTHTCTPTHTHTHSHHLTWCIGNASAALHQLKVAHPYPHGRDTQKKPAIYLARKQ